MGRTMDLCTDHSLLLQHQLAPSLQLDLSSSIISAGSPSLSTPSKRARSPPARSPLFCSVFLPPEDSLGCFCDCLPHSEHRGQGQVTEVLGNSHPWGHHHQPPGGQHKQRSCPVRCRTHSRIQVSDTGLQLEAYRGPAYLLMTQWENHPPETVSSGQDGGRTPRVDHHIFRNSSGQPSKLLTSPNNEQLKQPQLFLHS